MRTKTAAAAVLSAFLPIAAHAQNLSEAALQGQTQRWEEIDKQVAQSRYRVGPVRLRPRLGITGFGYNNSVTNEEGDQRAEITGRGHAGLTAILPVGRSLRLGGTGGVGYTWFSRSASRRSLGLQLESFLLAKVRRLSLETKIGSTEDLSRLSSEVESPVERRDQRLALDAEYDFGTRVSVFGSVSYYRPIFSTRGLDPGLAGSVKGLDQRVTTLTGGVRYRLGTRSSVSLNIQDEDAEYPGDPDRDHSSDSYGIGVSLDRHKLRCSAAVGFSRFQQKIAGTAPSREGVFGKLGATYTVSRLLTVNASAHRQRQDSISGENQFYEEQRVGAGWVSTLGSRGFLTIGGFVEVGSNRYPAPVLVGPDLVQRIDDVTTLQGSVGIPLAKWLRVRAEATRSRYDSTIPELSRTVFSVGTTISLSGGGVEVFE